MVIGRSEHGRGFWFRLGGKIIVCWTQNLLLVPGQTVQESKQILVVRLFSIILIEMRITSVQLLHKQQLNNAPGDQSLFRVSSF